MLDGGALDELVELGAAGAGDQLDQGGASAPATVMRADFATSWSGLNLGPLKPTAVPCIRRCSASCSERSTSVACSLSASAR